MSIGLKSKTVVLEPHQAEWEAEGKSALVTEIFGKASKRVVVQSYDQGKCRRKYERVLSLRQRRNKASCEAGQT